MTKRRLADDRQKQRADSIVGYARCLFAGIASRHGLAIEWDDCAQVDLAAHLRKQPGLDWDLWLNVQNEDEIGVQHEFFTADWFPADDLVKRAEFVAVMDGLITGDIRFACRFSKRGRRPYAVDLEKWSDGEWMKVYGYAHGIHLGRAASVQLLRNGHPTVSL